MRLKQKYSITERTVGIITLVMMPMLVRAQMPPVPNASDQTESRTFTAPPPSHSKQKHDEPKALAANEPEHVLHVGPKPHIDIVKVTAGNADHIPAGFYAEYKPNTFDTVFIYEAE